jgi:hypothetical protein
VRDIFKNLYFSIRWSRVMMIFSSSLLQVFLGIFLNISKASVPSLLNSINLLLSIGLLTFIMYALVKLWKRSESFGE